MINDERLVTFIHSLEKPNSPLLSEIEKSSRGTVPIIRKEMESFLRVMLTIKNPKNILELGTAVGYSALLMSESAKEAKIKTIENYDKRIPIAKENFKRAGKEDVIELVEGDALEVIKNEPDDTYDFVFMDAAKAQYIFYLPEIIRIMKKGGILITDNVLQDGDVVLSKFIVRRRDRTIHKRMREYLSAVKNSDELETTIVPIGDGITMSVKK